MSRHKNGVVPVPFRSHNGCRKGKDVYPGWHQEGHPACKTFYQHSLFRGVDSLTQAFEEKIVLKILCM